MSERQHSSSRAVTTEASTAAAKSSLQWRKSSYSNHQSACVELARIDQETIAFRDSKDPSGPVLVFTRQEATAFLAGVAHAGIAVRR
ncbi:DUF397 domain-containing protein [Wenjunlia vitaminophila]|uniref:DUF397 domain-containing protein n=1 Tax=Wenjunlia vitaminophila TaxID=76728 RepID=UPI000997CF9C|nr:DUF397 domain-containing protein [Wenjunlia vitaminophila]